MRSKQIPSCRKWYFFCAPFFHKWLLANFLLLKILNQVEKNKQFVVDLFKLKTRKQIKFALFLKLELATWHIVTVKSKYIFCCSDFDLFTFHFFDSIADVFAYVLTFFADFYQFVRLYAAKMLTTIVRLRDTISLPETLSF